MTTDVATTAQITKKELYDNYRNLRSRGLSPAQILSDYLTELHAHGFSVGGLISVVIGIVTFVVVDSILGEYRRNQDIEGELWVVSDDNRQPVKLPFWIAVRVIRKQGWGLADVEPVHVPSAPLTRWEHLKAALGWRVH